MKKFSPKTNNIFGDENIVDEVKNKGKISHGNVEYLPINYIIVGKYQVRENFSDNSLAELRDSILIHGILQPITVRKVDSQKYELISGERRYRAAKLAGITNIPSIVSYFTDEQALALGIIENVQRENINVLEEAYGYKRLIDEFGYTHIQISESIGKSRAHITNILRILTLSKSIQEALHSEEISLGHAKVILSVPEDKRNIFLQTIKNKHMSVRASEKYRDTTLKNDSNVREKFNVYDRDMELNGLQALSISKLDSLFQGRAILKKANYGRYKFECIFNSYEEFESFVALLDIKEPVD